MVLSDAEFVMVAGGLFKEVAFRDGKLYYFTYLFRLKDRGEIEFLEPKLRGRHRVDVFKAGKARRRSRAQ